MVIHECLPTIYTVSHSRIHYKALSTSLWDHLCIYDKYLKEVCAIACINNWKCLLRYTSTRLQSTVSYKINEVVKIWNILCTYNYARTKHSSKTAAQALVLQEDNYQKPQTSNFVSCLMNTLAKKSFLFRLASAKQEPFLTFRFLWWLGFPWTHQYPKTKFGVIQYITNSLS